MIFSRRVHLSVFSKFEEVVEIIRAGVQERFSRVSISHSAEFNYAAATHRYGAPTILVLDCRESSACAASLVTRLRKNPQTKYVPVIYLVEKLKESSQVTLRDELTDFCLLPLNLDELSTRIVMALRHRDVYRRLELNNQTLAQLATFDDLTGLYNRRFVTSTLCAETHNPVKAGGIGVYLIDLDNFKQVNDTYGHLAGDKVLQNFARMLTTCLRTSDVIGRFGGDEFCIVKLEADLESCLALANRLLECVRTTPLTEEDLPSAVPVTASVGVAYVPPGCPSSAPMLLSIADKALYKAKDAGRDGYVLLQVEPELARSG